MTGVGAPHQCPQVNIKTKGTSHQCHVVTGTYLWSRVLTQGMSGGAGLFVPVRTTECIAHACMCARAQMMYR